MKYAKEIIELMSPYHGRKFRMRDLVTYIKPGARGNEREAIRAAVNRALFALVDSGSILMTAPKCERSFALYEWRKQ